MLVTALGSLPGTDLAAATRLMLEELPDLPPMPELPARGVGSDMVGRALAMASGLGFDLQPAGWRLTDHSGADHSRARSQLRRDLDDWEESSQGFEGTMKLAVAGPWTLAAMVERPRGDRVLADHGARRDLTEAVAEGVATTVEELRRRMPGIQWVLQVDEPLLPAVQQGRVPTASGFSRHRGVDRPVLSDLLHRVAERVSDVVSTTALHCCDSGLDLEVVGRAGITTVALDPTLLAPDEFDPLASWLDRGHRVWWGVLAAQQVDRVPRPDHLVESWRRLVERLGLDLEDVVERSAFTPSCGLAAWGPATATAALRTLRTAADLVEESLT